MQRDHLDSHLGRHFHSLHGWGIVCGLVVVAGNEAQISESGDPWTLFICPGYGISPCGDEVAMYTPYRFSVRDYLWTKPMDIQSGSEVWIARPKEVFTTPAPAGDPRCSYGCRELKWFDSRISATSQVSLIWTPPVLTGAGADICARTTVPCPSVPESNRLIIARITLPGSDRIPILNSAIYNFY